MIFFHEVLGLELCLGVWNFLFYWCWKAWKACCTPIVVVWSSSGLLFVLAFAFKNIRNFFHPLLLSPHQWWSASLGLSSAICQFHFCHWFGFLLTPSKSATETLLFVAHLYSEDLGQVRKASNLSHSSGYHVFFPMLAAAVKKSRQESCVRGKKKLSYASVLARCNALFQMCESEYLLKK